MNMGLLKEIVEEYKKTNPKKGKKLEKLVLRYEHEKDECKKDELKKVIRGFLHVIFSKSIDNESQFIMDYVSQYINEGCHQIERKAGDGWNVSYTGAVRMMVENGKLIITNYIPREYKKGFYLDTPSKLPVEAKKREAEFYMDHDFYLGQVSKDMDSYQTVVSGGYTPNPGVEREFLEKILTCINAPRIKEIEKLKAEVTEKVRIS
ncbi:MAG: hypothetical protein J6X28_05495 [Bacilli bacterium]|nr:hypothetical protein [Bacilli bacterium]